MSTARVIVVIVLTGVATVMTLLAGFLLFLRFALGAGMERNLEPDEQPFWPVSAVLVVDVDYADGPRREAPVVLRLDPLDQDAMGLVDYVVRPNRWGDFELHPPHVLETRSEVYEHCLVAEAVLYDHSHFFREHVLPPGTCLRSDAPLEVVLER